MIHLSALQFAAAGATKEAVCVAEDFVAAAPLPARTSETDGGAEGGPRVPRHLALVLDAPRRIDSAGHLAALRETIRGCREQGVGWLSVLLPAAHNGHSAVSCEMLNALRGYVQSAAAGLAAQGVRLAAYPCAGTNGCGDGAVEAARAFFRVLNAAAELSVPAECLCVHFSAGCGGRAELLEALRQLAGEAAAGRLRASEVTAARLEEQLSARALPPVDLLVRTGGSQRISDFLLWQAAYAELLFLEVPWAQFRREHLRAALDDYARRRRTFGALPSA